MSFEARCHCGTVSVMVDAEPPTSAIQCNCSHCAIKGLLLAAVPGDCVTVVKGEDALVTYRFNRRVIDHRFCPSCGVQVYSRGTGPDGSEMAMINLRCVPDADLGKVETMEFDGASM